MVQIGNEIKHDKNWVKEGMLYALIGIGSRNRNLNTTIIKLSDRIGEIDIDYGETSCAAPNPSRSLRSEKLQQKLS